MRSDAYYKNYDVNIQYLGMFLPAIERIVDYQKTQGLHDLVNLETPAIERLAAPVASVSMAP